ncbi:MAG: hypothetical protein ACI97A_003233 [Planctomycetota bacterium]|jgi:hypothetical protein
MLRPSTFAMVSPKQKGESFMNKFVPILVVVLVGAMTRIAPVTADEGMWVPPAIGTRLPMARLKKMGFELTRDQLWSTEKPSLRNAFLQIGSLTPNGPLSGYGSGSFVSNQGLVLTNHHVAFDAIAALSSPTENRIKNGYAAKTLADELPCEGLGMRITTMYRDVTELVLRGVTKETSSADRRSMVSKSSAALLAEAKKNGFEDPKIESMLFDQAYYMVGYETYRDIRMVYAPPQMIGEYGGDIDNWMWPRHTGDFTYLRVYVGKDGARTTYNKDNVPFNPATSLKVSIAGYEPGDFSFIMGYPGSPTYRLRSSYSIEYREKFDLPANVNGLQRMADRLITRGKTDEEFRIKNASDLKSINNTLKNFEGKLLELRRIKLVDRLRAEEDRIAAWIKADPKLVAKYGDVYGEIARLYKGYAFANAAMRPLTQSTVAALFGNPQLAQLIGNTSPERAATIAPQLLGQIFPDDLDGQRAGLRDALKPYWDDAMLGRPAILNGIDTKNVALDSYVAELLPTKFGLDEIAKYLSGKLDNFYFLQALASSGKDFTKSVGEGMTQFNDAINGLRVKMMDAKAEYRGYAASPESNSTLRFTYGSVTGYTARDAVDYRYYTTLEGVVEKHTGTEPFNAPAKLLELAAAKDWGRYGDKKLGTLPVCFLSNNDITGGNSGSPIMNGRGELTGLAFDGNYEAMTSDYTFRPEASRTINVDIRYVLWCTEKVSGMGRLIEEMEVVGSN